MKKTTAKAIKRTRERDSLQRFGVSMADELLKRFDKLNARRGYVTRSEALQERVRESLEAEVLRDEKTESVGTISLIYNHHARNLQAKLTAAQPQALDLITANLHIHLDKARCLEMLVVRGAYHKGRKSGDILSSIKVVNHGKFVTTVATSGGHHQHLNQPAPLKKPAPDGNELRQQKAVSNKDKS